MYKVECVDVYAESEIIKKGVCEGMAELENGEINEEKSTYCVQDVRTKK